MHSKKRTVHKVVTIMAIVGIFASGLLIAQPLDEVQNPPITASPSVEAPSDPSGLLSTREEGKLARDVYIALYDVWGIRVFANMARGKQMHMDHLASLIEAQGLVDPVIGSGLGEFKNAELASLYTSLVAQGSQSLQAAFTVGSIIGDLGIYDLETSLLEAEEPYTIGAYTKLLRGSVNHMRPFARKPSRYRIVYGARCITAGRLEAIPYQ